MYTLVGTWCFINIDISIFYQYLRIYLSHDYGSYVKNAIFDMIFVAWIFLGFTSRECCVFTLTQECNAC